MKSFGYVNDGGYNKIIEIDTDKVNENGEYYVEIWSGQNRTMETTGMFCGSGYWSIERLNDFFVHYHINYKLKK